MANSSGPDHDQALGAPAAASSRRPWLGFGPLVIALLVTVAACATEPGSSESGGSEPGSSGTGARPEVVVVHEDVSYYGACGNEVLQLDGETFYPLLEDEELDVTRYGTGMGVHLSAVPVPSPGDDIGTLTVYSDGYARFVSENGKFDIWLTEETRTYNWVC